MNLKKFALSAILLTYASSALAVQQADPEDRQPIAAAAAATSTAVQRAEQCLGEFQQSVQQSELISALRRGLGIFTGDFIPSMLQVDLPDIGPFESMNALSRGAEYSDGIDHHSQQSAHKEKLEDLLTKATPHVKAFDKAKARFKGEQVRKNLKNLIPEWNTDNHIKNESIIFSASDSSRADTLKSIRKTLIRRVTSRLQDDSGYYGPAVFYLMPGTFRQNPMFRWNGTTTEPRYSLGYGLAEGHELEIVEKGTEKTVTVFSKAPADKDETLKVKFTFHEWGKYEDETWYKRTVRLKQGAKKHPKLLFRHDSRSVETCFKTK